MSSNVVLHSKEPLLFKPGEMEVVVASVKEEGHHLEVPTSLLTTVKGFFLQGANGKGIRSYTPFVSEPFYSDFDSKDSTCTVANDNYVVLKVIVKQCNEEIPLQIYFTGKEQKYEKFVNHRCTVKITRHDGESIDVPGEFKLDADRENYIQVYNKKGQEWVITPRIGDLKLEVETTFTK